MLKLGLIGYPVGHSLSPWIHNQLMDKAGLKGSYELMEIQPEDFDHRIQALKEMNLDGFNVTIPYKEKIINYLDEIDEAAEHLGAVNTVKLENGRWIGYNTDGIGYLKSIQNRFPHVELSTRKILVLGSGGAARGIIFALAEAGCKEIDVANRTVGKAEELIKELEASLSATAIDLEQASQNIKDYDFIIQTTSVGMNPNPENQIIKLEQLNERAIVSDIVYRPMETQFLRAAQAKGASIQFGHEMLLHQAVYSFQIWTGKKVDVTDMLTDFEAVLKGV
ncbi:shikimate dehydrogenase [Halobacillus salinarum]|uniref:Shikimate dehydrogenase (NADP(+)) n=1 Tax=Halobacillus salinarum TaxID=2932257 RepID=A0ABY4EVX0_9BACI|nr:shikimate dehydrogenase [Halobacillus salinarum]UOQ46316.1 shikimate dehydrogenase [Halobacillus salinarum]